MSGYRCVNYYELCRLCTASQGTKKIHIFSEEGKKKNLLEKISGCLPIVVSENDKLPKIICTQCLAQVELIVKFRETCTNAQTMLESCLNSPKLRNGGKDVSPKKLPTTATAEATTIVTSTSPPLLKTISNAITATTKTSNVPVTIGKTTLTKTTVQPQTKNSSDFLSSIIQAVGIQNIDEPSEIQIQPSNIQTIQQQPVQQYTITLDSQTLKSNQIHYKIEPTISIQEPFTQQITPPQQTISNNTLATVDEFLKLKSTSTKVTPIVKRKEPIVKIETSPVKKQKINLVLTTPPQHQQQLTQPQVKVQAQAVNTATTNATAPKTQTVSLQDLKFISSGNKCFVPITLKDGNDQQIMAQIDAKNLVLPTTTYLQMKLQPQITVDGQQVMQLTSATSIPSSISLAQVQPQFVQSQIQLPQLQAQQTSQSLQQTSIIPETSTLFTTSTGQNVTITHHPLQQQVSNATTVVPTVQTIPQHTSTIDTAVGKVQLTTLQNVASSNVTHPFPQNTAITFQRVKVDNDSMAQATTKLNTKEQIFKLPTVSNVITSSTNTVVANRKVVRKVIANTALVTKNSVVSVIPKTNAVESSVPLSAAITTTTSTTASKTTTTVAKPKSRTIVTTISGGSATTNTTITTQASSCDSKADIPTCNVCSKVFKRKEHLAQHMKLHLGLRPFKCEEASCNKAFSRKEHLMRHRVSHTGKKQFNCEICHKLFSRKDNLNKHRRSHEQKPTTIVYTVTEIKDEKREKVN